MEPIRIWRKLNKEHRPTCKKRERDKAPVNVRAEIDREREKCIKQREKENEESKPTHAHQPQQI